MRSGLGYAFPQVGSSSSKRLSIRESVRESVSMKRGEQAGGGAEDKDKGDRGDRKKEDRLLPHPYLSRTRHPDIMRTWAVSCPPLGAGGPANPLVPKNGMDRVRFVRRLEEEGARVFAHVNASVGFLEVTPLQVRTHRTYYHTISY